MKLAVVSDIHANHPALKSVLNEVSENVDEIINLGDIIGLMGYPSEVVTELQENVKYNLKGNHDVAVLEYNEGHVVDERLSEFELENTMDNLTNSQINWVRELPSYLEIPSLGLLLAHAQPTPELSSGYTRHNMGVPKKKFTSAAASINDELFNFVLLGHTHQQAALDCSKFGNDVIILNPGCVGQPIDGVAEYAIINTDTQEYTLNSIKYDNDSVKSYLKTQDIPRWW